MSIITSVILVQMPHLERLDLSYNQLTQLDTATLSSLPKLVVLKTNNNRVSCVSPGLASLHQMKVLSVCLSVCRSPSKLADSEVPAPECSGETRCPERCRCSRAIVTVRRRLYSGWPEVPTKTLQDVLIQLCKTVSTLFLNSNRRMLMQDFSDCKK